MFHPFSPQSLKHWTFTGFIWVQEGERAPNVVRVGEQEIYFNSKGLIWGTGWRVCCTHPIYNPKKVLLNKNQHIWNLQSWDKKLHTCSAGKQDVCLKLKGHVISLNPSMFSLRFKFIFVLRSQHCVLSVVPSSGQSLRVPKGKLGQCGKMHWHQRVNNVSQIVP